MHDLKEWFMGFFKRPPSATADAFELPEEHTQLTLTPPSELQAAREEVRAALEVVARMEEQARVALQDHNTRKAAS